MAPPVGTRPADRFSLLLEQAALAQENSRQLLRAVLLASPLPTLATGIGGEVLLWNPAAERMFGWKASEVLGGPLPIVPDEEEAQFQELHRRVLEGGQLAEAAVRRRRRDGSSVEVVLSSAPICDATGTVIGTMAVLEDVGGRRKLEEDLRQAQKLEALGRLAAGVAHDFNNLTTAVLLYSELLLGQLRPQSRLRRYAEEIQRAGERGTTLVNQLLAYTGQQAFHPQPVDLNELLADMDDLLRRLLGEDVELGLELAADAGWVLADRSQLEQMILNLAANARDAMPSGGRLTLKTARTEAAGTAYGPVPALGCVLLEVRDTGVGMNTETRQRAFDPFFTTKVPGKGTGLGLATVERVVKGAGGAIQLESHPGRGTMVRILLPQVEGIVEEGTGLLPAPGERDVRETVLLVEDEDAVRHSLAESLELCGYRVLTARRGQDALKVLGDHEGPVHLVITDLVMPGMNGRELGDKLARLRPGLPVLFISGYSDEARVAPLRGRPFFAKPFSAASFVRRVREVLDATADPGAQLAT
ncbi:MAG TPA: ATP-binding protein [Terriglobales bacterium]|nr:ATP-binding protein [Terriglobales bacterium]